MQSLESRSEQTIRTPNDRHPLAALADILINRIVILETDYLNDLSSERAQLKKVMTRVETGTISQDAGRLSLVKLKLEIDKQATKLDLQQVYERIQSRAKQASLRGISCDDILGDALQIVKDNLQRAGTCGNNEELNHLSNYAHNQLMRLNNKIGKLISKQQIEELLSSSEKLHSNNPTICSKIRALGKQAILELHLDNPVWVLSKPRMDSVVQLLHTAINRMSSGEESIA